MKVRTLVSGGLTVSSLILGVAASAGAAPSTIAATPVATDPVAVQAPAAPGPKPQPPMKRLPAKATAKDAQKAIQAYAKKSGHTYTVDSAAFDPVKPVKPQQRIALADIPPEVPTYFTYIDVDTCRKERGSKFDPQTAAGGRVVNHYQWCAWADGVITVYDPHPTFPNVRIPAGQIQMRITLMGWGSDKDSKHNTDIYVDDIQPIGGQGGLTFQNTSLTFRPFCDEVYGGGSCSLTSPAPSATLAAFKGGAISHLTISNSVTLPAASANNPDRRTDFNLGIVIEAVTSVYPGQVLTGGVVKALMRCDGANQTGRGGFANPACIFSNVLPTYSLSKTDEVVKEVAIHIDEALQSPNSTEPTEDHTKIIPSQLHRHVDPTKISENRRIATGFCDVRWGTPRPDGKHCDEYPFATSKEGANDDGNYGTQWDYSVKLVTPTHNTNEGSRRSAWYRADRILDSDAFNVAVKP